MNYIIDRSKWARGGNPDNDHTTDGYTYLLDDRGNMCCLGFVCIQDGFKKSAIRKVPSPASISFKDIFHSTLAVNLDTDNDTTRVYNTEFSSRAININDNSDISEEEREAQLEQLFNNHNHTVEFIN